MMTARKVHLTYRDDVGAIVERTVSSSEFDGLRDELMAGGLEILGAWDATLDRPKKKTRTSIMQRPPIQGAPYRPAPVPQPAAANTDGVFAVSAIVFAILAFIPLLLLFGAFIASTGT